MFMCTILRVQLTHYGSILLFINVYIHVYKRFMYTILRVWHFNCRESIIVLLFLF